LYRLNKKRDEGETPPTAIFVSPLFYLSLMAALPWQLIHFIPEAPKALTLFSLVRTFALFTAFKEVSLDSKHFRHHKLFFIVIAVIAAIHLITCSWLALNPIKGATLTEGYIRSLYWTITTLTTTGYGDITPTTDVGRIFAVFVMITGFSAFGVIVGNISNILMAKNRHSEANKEKLTDLALFMHHYDVPVTLQSDVMKFYRHKMKKRLSDNDGKIIADLPMALQNEIFVYMKIKLIGQLPIFKDLSRQCLTVISNALEPVSFMANEIIITKGEHGEEMFIIDHGEVVVFNDKDEPVAVLKHGQCFGEIALLMEVMRTATVTASNYCDAYRFKKSDFIEIARTFPELEQSFRRIMQSRLRPKEAA